MKLQLRALSRRYHAALQKQVHQNPASRLPAAVRLGRAAVRLGLETLDLARIHKISLTVLLLRENSSPARNRMSQRAEAFFKEAISPIEKTHPAGVESAARLTRQSKTLTRRTAQLATANLHLQRGVLQRKTAEEALRRSERHHGKMLRESNHLQKHLQHLTHQILSGQEKKRSKLSHDLQDEIAQTLLGINVRLLTLKKGARAHPEDLAKEIASTQRLVEKSVRTINRFAHKLNPA